MFDKNYLDKVREEKEKWEELYKKSRERDVKFVTDSEIPIKQLYTPLDVKDKNYLSDISFFFLQFKKIGVKTPIKKRDFLGFAR